jgi:membrane protease YdiL (CAAX protease family)
VPSDEASKVGASSAIDNTLTRHLRDSRAFLLATALVYTLPAGPLNKSLAFPLGHIFPWGTALGLAMITQEAVLIAALIMIVTRWERLPLSSIGLSRPSIAIFSSAVCAAALAIMLTAVMQLHLMVVPKPASLARTERGATALITLPLWIRLTQSLGNGLAEEIGSRGYVLERILGASNSTTLAFAISVAGSSLLHLPTWGPRYALMVLPGQAVFALLYVMRRNVWPCVAAHFLTDCFGAIVWPLLPSSIQRAFWRLIIWL